MLLRLRYEVPNALNECCYVAESSERGTVARQQLSSSLYILLSFASKSMEKVSLLYDCLNKIEESAFV